MNTNQSYLNSTNKSTNIYYVYVHRKISDNSIFYVGKGKKNRAYTSYGRNTYWKNIVNKYGYTVEIVQNYLPEWLALELEMYLIQLYKNQNYALCNITEGGEGRSGVPHSPETKEKISIANKGNKWNVGRVCTEETKKKISLAQIGKTIPLEVRLKHSEAIKGNKHWRAKLANIYDYKTNALIAENVVIREWARENNHNACILFQTTCADRSLPSNHKNRHQDKGAYAVYT